jgi:hypothetical protein
LLVAGAFSASRSLPHNKSNLAFLGMWIVSTRSDLAGFLPFDADALSSSNIQHMAHFRIKIKDCLVKLHKKKKWDLEDPFQTPKPPYFWLRVHGTPPGGSGKQRTSPGGRVGCIVGGLSIFCNLLLELQKPPAPVALQGRPCLSAKPHEYKRSLVWLNLPPLAKLGIPGA